jgi:hypothetical protein
MAVSAKRVAKNGALFSALPIHWISGYAEERRLASTQRRHL